MENVDAIVGKAGGALLAEFDDPERASAALRRLESRGGARVESCSPVPLAGDDVRTPRWPSMGGLVFAAGVVGAVIAYLVQWYVNARSYVLNIGGRPPHAVPAFVVVTFETTVLFAAATCFVGALVAMRLPRLWRAVNEIEGVRHATLDRYWIVLGVDARGAAAATRQELERLGAIRVVRVPPADA